MRKYSITTIVKSLERVSLQSLQNKSRIKRYLFDALIKGVPITFYDWECPPRTISKDNTGGTFLNYDVDLQKIFQGKIIDQYTELPRAVSQRDQEIRALKYLKNLGIPFRFVKLIADTNAYYITPESVKILGLNRVVAIFNEYKDLLISATKTYPTDTQVYLFSELIEPMRRRYDTEFRNAIASFSTSKNPVVATRITQQQIKRTVEHMGIQNPARARKIALRVIASYAAEGIVLESLSATKAFSNCVWMNIREIDSRTIAITNCRRLRRRLGPLPMWFPNF